MNKKILIIPLMSIICGSVCNAIGNDSQTNSQNTVTIIGKKFNLSRSKTSGKNFIQFYNISRNYNSSTDFNVLVKAFEYNISQSEEAFKNIILRNPQLFRDIVILFDNLIFLPDMTPQDIVQSAGLIKGSFFHLLSMKLKKVKRGSKALDIESILNELWELVFNEARTITHDGDLSDQNYIKNILIPNIAKIKAICRHINKILNMPSKKLLSRRLTTRQVIKFYEIIGIFNKIDNAENLEDIDCLCSMMTSPLSSDLGILFGGSAIAGDTDFGTTIAQNLFGCIYARFLAIEEDETLNATEKLKKCKLSMSVMLKEILEVFFSIYLDRDPDSSYFFGKLFGNIDIRKYIDDTYNLQNIKSVETALSHFSSEEVSNNFNDLLITQTYNLTNIEEILASYFDNTIQFDEFTSLISAFLKALGAPVDCDLVKMTIDGTYGGYERDLNWLKALFKVFVALTDIRKSLGDKIVAVENACINRKDLPTEEINSIKDQSFTKIQSFIEEFTKGLGSTISNDKKRGIMEYFNRLGLLLAQSDSTDKLCKEFFCGFAKILQEIFDTIVENAPYTQANQAGEKGSQTSSAGVKGNALTPVPGSTTAPISNSQEATQANVINAGENAVQNESYGNDIKPDSSRPDGTANTTSDTAKTGKEITTGTDVNAKLVQDPRSTLERNFEKISGERAGQNVMVAER